MAILTQEQFQEFIDSNRDLVIVTILRILKNKEDAEDCYQDLLMNILRKIRRSEIEITTSTRAYLLRTATNLAINKVNSKKGRCSQSLETVTEKESNHSDPIGDIKIIDEITKNTQNKTMKRYLDFYLQSLIGFKDEEIADQYGVTIGTVSSGKTRAKAFIKKELNS